MVNKKLSQETKDFIDQIMKNKNCTNWSVDEKDRRYINYTCHCGQPGRHMKQGLKRPQWNGCTKCSKKKSSKQTMETVKKNLENKGYKLVSLGFNRKVVYKCKHGEFQNLSHNICKNSFKGGCIVCRQSIQIKENMVKMRVQEEKDLKLLNSSIPIEFKRGEWYGGKHQGGISDLGERIKVTFKKEQGGKSKSFRKSRFGLEKAKLLAIQYRNRESVRRGLSKNMIRDVTVVSHPIMEPGYTFKEMTLNNNKIMLFENENLKQLECLPIRCILSSSKTNYYAETGSHGKQKRIHNLLYPEFSQVDHIDRNGLNNLKCNVREGGGRVNATNRSKPINNTSGYKGVRRENGAKARWKASWVDRETGKRRTKSFSIKKYGDEEAKRCAIAWRNEYAPKAEEL
jgi:hypothetical protein